MTASKAKSAAPAYSVMVWADEKSVYGQLPSVNGPYVACFPKSEGGLSRLLQELGAMHVEHSGEVYIRPDLPSKDLQSKGLTQNDRDQARDALKKLGIIS